MKIQAEVKFKVSVEFEVPDNTNEKEIDRIAEEEAIAQFQYCAEVDDIDAYEL